jgi:hypothetical protein
MKAPNYPTQFTAVVNDGATILLSSSFSPHSVQPACNRPITRHVDKPAPEEPNMCYGRKWAKNVVFGCSPVWCFLNQIRPNPARAQPYEFHVDDV